MRIRSGSAEPDQRSAPLPAVTEELVRLHASPEVFRRGEEYVRQGAVASVVRRGDELHAEVEGSEPLPYAVRVGFDATGVADALCSCPYDWGGWCKHIVAVLLASLRAPDEIAERPPLDALLAGLDADQLRALVLRLAERDVDLIDEVERALDALRPATPAGAGATPTPAAPVDERTVRQEVRQAFRGLGRMSGSEAYYHEHAVLGDVGRVLEQAWVRIKAGDGAGALAVMDALTQEYLDNWEMLDGSSGESGEFFGDLGRAWTEALLTADLTPAQRQPWARKLETWAGEVDDYGVEEAFDAALGAAEQGWEFPPLVRAMRGEAGEDGAWESEAPWYADALTDARLEVLERQGRVQEFLHLARAEGRTVRYAGILARQGRTGEAVEHALGELETAEEAFTLAGTLREAGASREALRIAERGLSLDGPKAVLATWLRDLAAEHDEGELALRAAEVAFREAPTLPAYQRIETLAGPRWPELRAGLLDSLRQTRPYSPAGPVDVFLHEGLVDDAIAAVQGAWDYDIVRRVVDAAVESRPDWAITTARAQADSIMDAGQSAYYDVAADWLHGARRAHEAAGRQAEWREHIEALIARHARKYKLRPLLEALR